MYKQLTQAELFPQTLGSDTLWDLVRDSLDEGTPWADKYALSNMLYEKLISEGWVPPGETYEI